jgi:group I intron endonuclease
MDGGINISYIYKIENVKNGKFYIGSAKDFENRKSQHIYQLNNNIHINKHLQNAWNKYGKSNFEFKVIEEIDYDKQFEIEQKYLDELKPFGDNGYNISTDASNGFKREIQVKYCESCGEAFVTYYENQKYCCEKCDPSYNPNWEIDYITNQRIASSPCTYDCDIDYDEWSVEDWIHAYIVDAMEK